MKKKLVIEWFERGKRDYETALLVFKHRGYCDEVIFLIHQAMEKYLKGYLIFHGWDLKKTHDIEVLLYEAKVYEPRLEDFLDFGRKLTAFYYESRYPPGTPIEVSQQEADEAIKTAQKIIDMLRRQVDA